MRAKTEERNRARKLRSKGWSLREIAAELGVALSSVSTWVRDVPIPQPKPATRALVGGVPLRSIPVIADPSKLRRCCRCRLRKPLSAFNRNGDDRQWYCRDCFRDYFKARGALHRKQVDIARVRRRSKSRQLVEARRRSGCVDCGVKDPLVLEFDHRDGDKVRHVAEMAWEGASPVSVTAELAKCDVVCVNCHKHRTYSRLPSCWRLDPIGIDQPAARERREAEPDLRPGTSQRLRMRGLRPHRSGRSRIRPPAGQAWQCDSDGQGGLQPQPASEGDRQVRDPMRELPPTENDHGTPFVAYRSA